MKDYIQKSIIRKYLYLAYKEQVTETEIYSLIQMVETLFREKLLDNRSIYRQKIEIIMANLKDDLETVRRKRTNKFITLSISNELKQTLSNNIEGNDVDLSDYSNLKAERFIDISTENVQDILQNLVINKRRLNNESDFEKFVGEQLQCIFGKDNIHRQYSIGGFLALKSDIDIGDGLVGIELKIADNLSASDMQRLIGQVVYYKRRFYKSNLILFIASKMTITPSIKELKNFIEELGVIAVFSTAIN